MKRFRDRVHASSVLLVVAGVLTTPAWADLVTLTPSKDNTLYEDPAGSLSNGAGQHIFAGRSGVTTNNARRALLAFDVAGNVPAGATIDSVTLTLHMSMAPFGAIPQLFDLRRVLSDWGSGLSDAPFQEGGGTNATSGDATWDHTFFNTQFWNNDGGDFTVTASSTLQVGEVVAFYTWGPTAQMQADVQSWLDDPDGNFGWLMIGNEGRLQTARRFDSVENPEPLFRPALVIEFTTSSTTGAGRVPNGGSIPGTPLTINRAAGDTIRIDWGASCGSEGNYEVYAGNVGDFTSHLPLICSTGGATFATVPAPSGSSYYLVVPRTDTIEGSYGTASDGTPRPQSIGACLMQSIASCP